MMIPVMQAAQTNSNIIMWEACSLTYNTTNRHTTSPHDFYREYFSLSCVAL